MRRLFLTGAAFFLLFTIAFGITAQEEEQLVQQTLALFGRAPLAVSDSLPTPRICGTATYFEAKRRFSELSAASQTALSPLLFARPVLQTSYAPPSGRFRIHYSTTGPKAVRNALIDLSPANGVPDWVDTLGMVLDSIWDKEIVQMGFRSPVKDGFYPQGVDSLFDIYLDELGSNFLGYTVPDSAGLGPLQNQSTAFIVLDNDYAGIPGYPEPDGPRRAIRIAATHEFFHAIQFAYNVFGFEVVGGNGLFYWQEATAVWMEEQMYPQINDYVQYLPYWFGRPELSFRTFSTAFGTDPLRAFRPYAMGIYGIFLSTRFPAPPYGYSVVRRIWEGMAAVPDFNLFAAIDDALSPLGSDFRASLREFYQWNYFTGPRSLSIFYGNESAPWPTFDQSGFPGSRIDITDMYPTRFPNVLIPCGNCPPDSISFFCSPCSINPIGFPCSTKCPPICAFVPYQPSDQLPCLTVVEDLGASYLSLQNAGQSSSMLFNLLGAPNRPTTWFAAAAAYDTSTRNYGFVTSTASNPTGQINDLTLSNLENFSEAVITVVNDTVLPVDANRKGSLYAYSVQVPTGVRLQPGQIPQSFTLHQNYPNPFNTNTEISFALATAGTVLLEIFNLSGQRIGVLIDKKMAAGAYSATWDGRDSFGRAVSSGIYFYRLITENFSETKRMVLLK